MTNNTKTIYYAFVQKLEVLDSATEEEIDDLVFNQMATQVDEPVDYIWSDQTKHLFEES